MKTARIDLKKALAETVLSIRNRVDIAPRVGLVLGSDSAGYSERLRAAVELPYASIPHMPTAGSGSLFLGFLDDVPIACLEGRYHLGDTLPPWQLVHGVRTMARLGVKMVLVVETVGAVEPTWAVGSIMVVVDHLNFSFHEGLGDVGGEGFESFPNMRAPYDAALRDELHEVARTENMLSARIGTTTKIELVEGVYAQLQDPSYETPAQVRMLRALGADAVGVGMALEVVALRQLGVRVAGLAHLAYRAADTIDTALDDEVTARSTLAQLQRLIRGWMVRAHRL